APWSSFPHRRSRGRMRVRVACPRDPFALTRGARGHWRVVEAARGGARVARRQPPFRGGAPFTGLFLKTPPAGPLQSSRSPERVLEAHLEGLGARVERGLEVTALTYGEGEAKATLRHANGRDESVVVPWVVGCDGAHSVVRRAIDATFEGSPYEERLVLADV